MAGGEGSPRRRVGRGSAVEGLEVAAHTSRRNYVRLKVEYLTNTEGLIINWTVRLVTLLLLGVIIALSVLKYRKEPDELLFASNNW